MMRRLFGLLGLSTMCALLPSAVWADAIEAGDVAKAALAKKKDEAKERFLRGVEHIEANRWDAALAELSASFQLFPTKNALKNMALCLRKLGRFDQSLAEYQRVAGDYSGQLSAEEAKLVNKAILDLQDQVGMLLVTSNVPGAIITVDNKIRGAVPLGEALTVIAGTHTIRVTKLGYIPFETSAAVPSHKVTQVTAHLERITRKGELAITETEAREAEVILDGIPAGKTPFSLEVVPGKHLVLLRGSGKLGTQPILVDVKEDTTTPVRLTLEDLAAEARLDVNPPNSKVILDGVPLGSGSFTLRLRRGSHQLVVSADGYFAVKRTFDLTDAKTTDLNISLERDDESPVWRVGSARRFSLTLVGGALFGVQLGGNYEGSCDTSAVCTDRRRPFGGTASLRISYEVAPALALEVEAGYFGVSAAVTRSTKLIGELSVPVDVNIQDDVSVLGGLGVVGAAVRLLRVPVSLTVGLGLGAAYAVVRTKRQGSALGILVGTSTTETETRALPDTSASVRAAFFTLVPSVRVGLPLGSRVEVGLDVSALIGFGTARPTVVQTLSPSGLEQPKVLFQGAAKPFGALPAKDAETAVGSFILPRIGMYTRLSF